MIIQIGDFEFDLSERYVEGQQLTHGEAYALNGLRAERIRARIARDIDSFGKDLTAERILDLKAYAKTLDEEFEFLPPARPKKRTSTELEVLIREIAGEKLRANGGDLEDWISHPSTIEQARAILGARREAAKAELEDL